jgi:hypothetical protein
MIKSTLHRALLVSSLLLVSGTFPALAADAAKTETSSAYPLTTCVVSGEALEGGDMGGPIDYIHKEEGKPDRLVRFCCSSCVKKFKKDPAKYLAKLDAAAAAAAAKPAATAPAESHSVHAH